VSQADEQEPILPPEEEAAWLAALEAALRPQPLAPARAEQLLELALEDPLAPPSIEELAESARLRDALAGGAPHESAALLHALRAPFVPAPSAEPSIDRAVDSALAKLPRRKPASTVIYARFGAASLLLAGAAAIALFVSQPHRQAPAPAAGATGFVAPHSTADLFDERFETSSTTQRMDLIASVRSRDLRDNRYAAWGAR
jgi:hypothetical protein